MADLPPDIARRIERQRENQPSRYRDAASLGEFLPAQFRREFERPHQELEGILDAWERLTPASVLARTGLRSFRRGVLTVVADSSATMYELDRALKSGLEQELRIASRRRTLRRVRIVVDPSLSGEAPPG
ncbi:MAG: DciA family protein [Phycisphaerales bacterium]